MRYQQVYFSARRGARGLAAATVLWAGLATGAGAGAEIDKPEPPVSVIRSVGAAPIREGQLDEEAWQAADVLTGFTVPLTLDRATQPSEARWLHDATNLYLYVKAREAFGGPVLEKEGDSPFKGDNFEIFIQPDPGSDTYYQVVVSARGGLYAARGRNPEWQHGIRAETVREPGAWSLAVTLPLADLGLAAPGAGETRRIRFNICRNDHSAPAPAKGFLWGSAFEPSSFAVLDSWHYHQPDTWPEAVLTRESDAEPRTHVPSSPRVNLFVNPSFDLVYEGKPVAWSLASGAARQESMALSGEWLIRADGTVYHFLEQGAALVPGRTYTIRVRARLFGSGQTFGIAQRIKGPDGKTRTSSNVAWQIPLTTEFHEFFLPFRADADRASFLFYRIGDKSESSGVEIEAVHLVEGELSPLEIRKVARVGGKRPAEGDRAIGPAIPPNLHGPKADNPRVLALVAQLQASREIFSLLAGLECPFDVLMTTGRQPSDVYYTDFEPAEILKRIDGREYDLYLVGNRALPGVGQVLADKIAGNVRAGAGLWINHSGAAGSFKALLDDCKPQPVPDGHYLRRGLPIDLYPARVSRRDPNRVLDPRDGIREARAGEGRVVLTDTVPGSAVELRLLLPPEAYGCLRFPYRAYSDAWLARAAYYAAGKVPAALGGVAREGNVCAVGVEGEGAGASVRWRLEDKTGGRVAEGRVPVRAGRASFDLPAMPMSGLHALALWLEDADGRMLDYAAGTIRRDGPRIVSVTSGRESYEGAGPARFEIRTADVDSSLRLAWTLEDFSGRILVSGSEASAETVSVSVPLQAVYTTLARFEASLRDGGTVRDAAVVPVYVRDRDRARLWNDFTVDIWNPGSDSHPDELPFIAGQMERIGVRCFLMPANGVPVVLNEGLGVGGGFRGGGDVFCALRSYENHVRAPSWSDPGLLKGLKDRAEGIAKEEFKYGVVNAAVCDEPNDARPESADEIDAHPDNLKEYRARMRGKYGTIEAFNARCGTGYKTFEDLGIVLTEAARARTNFAEFVEWRNYNVDRYIEAIRILSDAGRKLDGAPLSLYNSFGHMALSANDFWKLLTKAGLDFSHEYTAMVYMSGVLYGAADEFYRSFRPDMRVWGFIGYYWGARHAAFQPWWFALHRYGGFTWYAALAGTSGGGTWHNLLDIPNFGLTQDAAQLTDGLAGSGLLDGLGKLFLEYEWQPRDVAVLYSQPSLLVAWCRGTETRRSDLAPGSPNHAYHHSRASVRHALEELLYQYDFVAPEQVREGALDAYRALVLPHIEALSDEDVRLMKAFMARGGTVIADVDPGAYDELGTPRGERPFAAEQAGGRLVCLGSRFDDRDGGQRARLFALLKQSGAQPVASSDKVPGLMGREAMRFVSGGLNVYAITRNFARSDDAEEQSFTFDGRGHLYDLREGRYLGETNRVTRAIPNAGTAVFGLYPYRVTGLDLILPDSVKGGTDLVADLAVATSGGAAGYHVFHVAVEPPEGEARWFMKRNLAAPDGRVRFVFRLAENDPKGTWTLRARDVLTGATVSKPFNVTP